MKSSPLRFALMLVLALIISACDINKTPPKIEEAREPSITTGIFGQVFNAAGAAAPNQTVSFHLNGSTAAMRAASTSETRTDAEGYFEMELPAGVYDAYAMGDEAGAAAQDLTVAAGSVTEAAMNLSPLGAISGTARYPDKTEHDGITVTVPGTNLLASTTATGEFTLPLPEGTYTLTAFQANYGHATSVSTTVESGETTVLEQPLVLVVNFEPEITITQVPNADEPLVHSFEITYLQESGVYGIPSDLVVEVDPERAFLDDWREPATSLTVDVYGILPGPTTITASHGSYNATLDFAISSDEIPTDLYVELDEDSGINRRMVPPGSSFAVTPYYDWPLFFPADPAALKWSSSDPSVATVGEDGIVTALADGDATITAEHELLGIWDSVSLSVGGPHIVIEELTYPGDSALTFAVAFVNEEGQHLAPDGLNVSVNPNEAHIDYVSDNGDSLFVRVYGIKPGPATLTATYADHTQEHEFTITTSEAPNALQLSFDYDSGLNPLMLATDLSFPLYTMFAGPNWFPANPEILTWTSSNENTATVIDGIVTTHAAGAVTVTALHEPTSSSATFNFRVIQPGIEVIEYPYPNETVLRRFRIDYIEDGAYSAPEGTHILVDDPRIAQILYTRVENNRWVVDILGISEGTTKLTASQGEFRHELEFTIEADETPTELELRTHDMETPITWPFGDTPIGVSFGPPHVYLRYMPSQYGISVDPAFFTWTSSNENAATVTDGIITTHAAGEVTITAVHEPTGRTDSFSFTVIEPGLNVIRPTEIHFEYPVNPSVPVYFTVEYIDENSVRRRPGSVDVTLDDDSFLYAGTFHYEPWDGRGHIFLRPEGVGTTDLVFEAEGYSVRIPVTVEARDPDGVELWHDGVGIDRHNLDPSLREITIRPRLTYDGMPYTYPGDAGEFEWTSEYPEVASVDAAGVVTARGDGTTTIEARHTPSGLTSSVEIQVSNISPLLTAHGYDGPEAQVIGYIPDYNAGTVETFELGSITSAGRLTLTTEVPPLIPLSEGNFIPVGPGDDVMHAIFLMARTPFGAGI